VTTVTSRRYGSQYAHDVGDDMGFRRSTMTTSLKETGARFRRWFKALQEKNRPPYRWYENGYYDA
jgi:hypothetical protein